MSLSDRKMTMTSIGKPQVKPDDKNQSPEPLLSYFLTEKGTVIAF